MSSIPIGYLISPLLLALCTYFVVAPSNWPRIFNSLGSYFGVINELPFLALFWLISSTWLAFSEGDVYSPVGWLAFGLTMLVVVGLMVIIYRGLQAAPVVSRALDDSLEEGWRASINHKIEGRLQKKFVAKALLGPFFKRRYDVERIANISYGNAGVRNLLDIYRHRSHPTGCPVLVHLHGGGFVRGRKNSQSLPLIYQLASQGWVCISANYRLSPAARFPDHLIDVKKVIAWVREHGYEYGADPMTIFLAGNSAGGHLAAMAALTPNAPTFQPGFECVDTSVTAVICLYGYYDYIDRKTGAPSSPMACSGKDVPPFFVAHGDQDRLVPVKDVRLFAEHLRNSSTNPVIYVELPRAEHNFDLFHSIRTEAVVQGIEAFAAWVMANNKHNSHPS
ncbi:alpha/beta hydrolase [Peribacillus loiseleuriae]|uniref:alpha/beta hydrolase n=1 Tax=Peribacillus loiseleuriae TaxID=1679170 RepID=UPI0038309D32